MLPLVNTKHAPDVALFLRDRFTALFPGAPAGWLMRVFRDVDALFAGRHPDYQAIDVGYHDYEHTLQVTVCLVHLLEGWQATGTELRFTARQFEIAVAAALLHDSGYLRSRSDQNGTGAKFTYCHVLRSCAFLASYLPSLGATSSEVEGALEAINCTGPTVQISRLRFNGAAERIVGSVVATADYLGQMADPGYPDKLGVLYREFQESDDYLSVPQHQRLFKSEQDLVARTPFFWTKFVQPKLETDFQGVHRYLARPAPGATHAYLEAIEHNIAEITHRAQAAAAPQSLAAPAAVSASA